MQLARWLLAFGGTAVVTAAGHAMHLNPTAVGFAYLMVVLMVSIYGGLFCAMVTSVVATLAYNYFFFPPLHTFTIHDPANWVALAVFLATSVTVSRLVIAARVAAERAEQRGRELVALAVERERLLEEQAHVEALRESDTLKTSLLRAISHDLTTPLTAITLHTEALRRRAERDAELDEPVAGIADETARLHRRIDNLLAMARLEAGKSKPRREPTPPADLFRAARENLPLVFQSRAVSIRVEDDCPDANVDPALALEILVNLIENAHRAAPLEAPLELTARMLDRTRVRMEVLDRGPGFPAEANARHGLGLEIARSLAAANGGTVALAPRPGGGTIARLDVPSAPLPPLAVAEAS